MRAAWNVGVAESLAVKGLLSGLTPEVALGYLLSMGKVCLGEGMKAAKSPLLLPIF